MLKSALLTLALFSGLASAAELRVLENFNPATKKYTGVISSTTEAPLSIAPALNSVNGLCYKGSIEDVSALLNVMVAIYNAEQSEVLFEEPMITAPVKPNGPMGILLNYSSRTETGSFEWDSIPTCVR